MSSWVSVFKWFSSLSLDEAKLAAVWPPGDDEVTLEESRRRLKTLFPSLDDEKVSLHLRHQLHVAGQKIDRRKALLALKELQVAVPDKLLVEERPQQKADVIDIGLHNSDLSLDYVKARLEKDGSHVLRISLATNVSQAALLSASGVFDMILARAPNLQELDLSATTHYLMEATGLAHLGKFLAKHRCIRRLCLRKTHVSAQSLASILEGARQCPTLKSLDLEYMSTTPHTPDPAKDKECANFIAGNETLEHLNISYNGSMSKTISCISSSRIDNLELRGLILSEADIQSIFMDVNHIELLDLRNTNIHSLITTRDSIGKALYKGIVENRRIYRLRLNDCPTAVRQALPFNRGLGILSLQTPAAWTNPRVLGQLEFDLGDNITLFQIDPLTLQMGPKSPLLLRLEENQELARMVRRVVIFMLTMHQYHRADSGALAQLPRDIMHIIAKRVWYTRRDRKWLKRYRKSPAYRERHPEAATIKNGPKTEPLVDKP